MSDMKNVTHIEGEGMTIGKTVAMFKHELQELTDSFAGSINNAEAIGALVLQIFTVVDASQDDD